MSSHKLLFEKYVEIFPNLEEYSNDLACISMKESENLRNRFLRDLYYSFILEFQGDVDNITRVQIYQNISGDCEMIPALNLMCVINDIFPFHNIGLWDLITPSVKLVWSEMDFILRYHNFCDSVFSIILDRCKDYTDADNGIKELYPKIRDLENSTATTFMNIDNKRTMSSSCLAQCTNREDENKKLMQEMREIEKRRADVEAVKNVLKRKTLSATVTLNQAQSLVETRKNRIMNHSLNCEDKLDQLKEELKQIEETKKQICDQIPEKKKQNLEVVQMKDEWIKKSSLVDEIMKAITQVKILEEEKIQLDDINKQIENIEKEKDKPASINFLESDQFSSTNSSNQLCEFKKELEVLKTKFQDLKQLKKESETLDIKRKTILSSYTDEESELMRLEKEIVERKTHQLNRNKASSEIGLKIVKTKVVNHNKY